MKDRGNLSLLGCTNAISTIDAVAAHEAIGAIPCPAMAARPLWLRAAAGPQKPLALRRPPAAGGSPGPTLSHETGIALRTASPEYLRLEPVKS